jgi:hypothetical protein
LLYLIGFGLPIDILQIDQFWDVGMDINMMAAVNAGQPKAKRFRTCHRLCKADIFRTSQQFLE